MRIVIFCQSLVSDWNHGNAHFLRGVVTELQCRGWDVRVWEPAANWSVANLVAEHGQEPLRRFASAYPTLRSQTFEPGSLNLDEALNGTDVVLVHEWNEPELVSSIGKHHARNGSYTLLFHDTHHRSVTDPGAMSRYDLDNYDGVLAFGESVSEVYRRNGWGKRVWTWHEAADTRRFHPMEADNAGDLVWIGNWGDNERTRELQEFLMEPVRSLQLQAVVHGVRYPSEAIALLADAGIEYANWLPNFEVPQTFAAYRVTVHVPRRPYASALPGVPTIRVFEALACGIPLVSAPWLDSEGLFREGQDFLFARSGTEMKQHLRTLLNEPDDARALARSGRETILARHTCAHRIDELEAVLEEIDAHSFLRV